MNTITNELVAEYGSEILSINNPYPKGTLSLAECYKLINKYGYEKAEQIVKRHSSLRKVGK
jgi:hypothetical protein